MPTPALAARWTLDPEVVFLNHGSFGATPRSVLAEQDRLRAAMEREPVRFLVREIEPLLDTARARLGAFIGADPEGLAFVSNATTGVCTILACLPFAEGDEVITTDQVYPAVRNAITRRLAPLGGRLIEAPVPFPIAGPDDVVEAVLAAVTPRTRLAVLDHITSATALVFPIERLVRELAARGIETLVDGAHAPGQVALAVDDLGAAYYVGNCHKWLCAPKGAGFLWARGDRRDALHPLVASHGMTSKRTDRSRFRLEFDWPGTSDFTSFASVPAAIDLASDVGGWDAWREANHTLAVEGRKLICEALAIPEPCPAAMIGAMASIPLPPGSGNADVAQPLFHDPLQELLYRRNIEIPIFNWPAWPARLIRISCQRYNHIEQYELLAGILKTALQA